MNLKPGTFTDVQISRAAAMLAASCWSAASSIEMRVSGHD